MVTSIVGNRLGAFVCSRLFPDQKPGIGPVGEVFA